MGGDGRCAGGLHAAQRHTGVFGLDDHADNAVLQSRGQPVRNLSGEANPRTNLDPTSPVPPMTTIFMMTLLHALAAAKTAF